MKRAVYFIALLAFVALATSPADSHVRSASSSGVLLAWNLSNPSTTIVSGGRIVYSINAAGSADVPFADVERALDAAFKVWEDIPSSTIAFTKGATTNISSIGNNGIFPVFWVENSTMVDRATGGTQNISGALAVTFNSFFTSSGEISRTSLVFNGNEYQWATNGDSSKIDIAEVAAHEIGHAIGLDHSPIGSATMFPRTGSGVTRGRSLSPDDQIAASIIYPTPGFSAATGTIQGQVSDGVGNNIFGAHVVAVDANGNVVASALSQPNGSYSIQGLSPGTYTVYAEPIDPDSVDFFNKTNLGSFYNTPANGTVNTNFQVAADQAAVVTAGAQTVRNFTVNAVAPAIQIKLIRDPVRGFYSNTGKTVSQGQTGPQGVSIGVSGTGLPTSGTPLSVSGPGITILSTQFGTLSNGDPFVGATINVAADAVPGARNIIITNGERAIATGALEIVKSATIASVSAANYAPYLSGDSIAALFGKNLASAPQGATTLPLPTTLGGVSISVRDSQGTTRPASLFYVSPGQVNYQIPAGTQPGPALVSLTTSSNQVLTETVQITSIAPSLFTFAGTGTGVVAGYALRVRGTTQTIEPIAQFNGQAFVSVPIDLDPSTDQVFLVIFGTGFRNHSSRPVTVSIGGVAITPTYAGPAPGFVGLDQVNIPLSQSLANRGEVDLVMTVDGQQANVVRVSIQ
jgi:uncharacterized protein (TIGR03437 family)